MSERNLQPGPRNKRSALDLTIVVFSDLFEAPSSPVFYRWNLYTQSPITFVLWLRSSKSGWWLINRINGMMGSFPPKSDKAVRWDETVLRTPMCWHLCKIFWCHKCDGDRGWNVPSEKKKAEKNNTWITGSLLCCSLSLLLMSSWSNLMNLRGSPKERGQSVQTQVRFLQISPQFLLPSSHLHTYTLHTLSDYTHTHRHGQSHKHRHTQ